MPAQRSRSWTSATGRSRSAIRASSSLASRRDPLPASALAAERGAHGGHAVVGVEWRADRTVYREEQARAHEEVPSVGLVGEKWLDRELGLIGGLADQVAPAARKEDRL